MGLLHGASMTAIAITSKVKSEFGVVVVDTQNGRGTHSVATWNSHHVTNRDVVKF